MLRASLFYFAVSSFVVGAAWAAKPNISTICIEAETGLVLAEDNAGQVRPPESMIKMMLMLLVAEGLEEGAWSVDTPITVSKNAERMGGTQVYLAAQRCGEIGS